MNRESERKRLVELMYRANERFTDDNMTEEKAIETLAEFLLDNGIVVPPVKVGQTVWANRDCFCLPYTEHGKVIPCEVIAIKETKKGKYILLKPLLIETFGMRKVNAWFPFSAVGKTVFTSREDAVKALEGSGDR